MKKIPLFLAAFLICTVSLTACGKMGDALGNTTEDESRSTTEELTESIQSEQAQSDRAEDKLLAEQKELYTHSIKALDNMLSDNREKEQNNDIYREMISSIYLFSKSYSGALRADYNEDGINAFQIVIADDNTEEKQRYECRLLSDGSMWFTCQTENKCGRDLADYIVNEDVLRYSRADYVYDDGQDLEEEKELRRQKAEQCIAEKVGGEVQEFWCNGDFMYRIDREEETFVDAAKDKESCTADFLWEQSRRVYYQLAVSEESLEAVEKYKPEGYSVLSGKNAWDEIAVSDLNHDGRMDYVAALYPDDYEEVKRYADWSPYELTSQYYAASYWLLLSSEEGGYEQISLSNSIEYWEDALVLIEVTFVDEGILQLEYFVGRSPFTNALLRFRYDEEKKNFYIVCSYYRDSFDDSLLIGGVENYGETSMGRYFGGFWLNYCEGNWQSTDNVYMQDGTRLRYYSDSFEYRCENPLEEHHINSLIWEKEYELIQAYKQHYPDEDLDVSIYADPAFYSSRLVSGEVEMRYAENSDRIRVIVPIMVDKQRGEYVMVTQLLQKEDFMQIFDDWSDDALTCGDITAEAKGVCERVIEKSWEKADTIENYFGEQAEILSLQIVQEGVRMGVEVKGSWEMNYYTIDKEYFWGTEVWDYFGI